MTINPKSLGFQVTKKYGADLILPVNWQVTRGLPILRLNFRME